MSDTKHYANLLKNIVLEGGKLARAMKQEASIQEKADRSLVTAADLAVTEMVKSRLEAILKQENHILIDEESAADLPSIEEAMAYEYQWVLDPIDGTAPYSAGLPFYAVSLGLMKNGKPWLGAAFMPDPDELFWTDENGNVMHQKGASGGANPRKLQVEDAPVFEKTPYFHELYIDGMHDLELDDIGMSTGSNVYSALEFFNSHAAGFVGNAYIWDQSAVFAMAQNLGYKIENARDSVKFESFNEGNLRQEDWLLKEPFIIAKKENMDFVRSKVLKEKVA